MTELTLQKVRLVMLYAEAMRLQGEIASFNEPLSADRLSQLSGRIFEEPIPEIVFRRVTRCALRSARLALTAHASMKEAS